jgi:hypothetical protein
MIRFRGRRVVTLAVTLALGLLIGAALPGQAQEGELDEPLPDEPACFDRAGEISRLSDDQARRLCGASMLSGPVTCFEAAAERTDLSTDDAITLCQCAPPGAPEAPVSCYQRGLNTDMLSSDALRMCSQTFSSLFPPVCLR